MTNTPDSPDSNLKQMQWELINSILRKDSMDEIRILLASGAKVNEPHILGLRPIHYAANTRYEKVVKMLLVRGCDVNAMDDIGYTAMHMSAERGYNDVINLLIQYGACTKFTQLRPEEEQTVNNYPRVTIADEPLRLAIKNGHLETAELLLKNGADPNARYYFGSEINLISPLHINFHKMLLKYGAYPDSRDRHGLTSLMRACRHPLGYAAAQILIHYGADVNAISPERNDYRSVLHYAVLSNNTDIVRLLLHHDANARFIFPTPIAQKPTPLVFALLNGNVEMVKLLIEAGADLNVGSPIIGYPLHIVLSEEIPNKAELVDLLLELGADPNAITKDDHGPLLKPPIGEYLRAARQPDALIVSKLLKYGAKIVLTTQSQNPIGILKVMNRLNLLRDHDVIDLILEDVESFNLAAIKRVSMDEDLRERILETVSKPKPLMHQARCSIRKIMENNILYEQGNVIKNVRSIKCPLYEPKTDCQELDEEQLKRLDEMTPAEIDDAFLRTGNTDWEQLKLLSVLLKRSSEKIPQLMIPGSQIIKRIMKLKLPEIIKCYLNYEISFLTIEDVMPIYDRTPSSSSNDCKS